MVNFGGKVWNLQGMENARKDKVESATKGNCKEWNKQGMELARKPSCK